MTWQDWIPSTSPSTPPSKPTLAWLARELDAQIIDVEPLVGGLSSAVHRISIVNVNVDGVDVEERRVVLRRYTLAEWLEREPCIPHQEARTLARLRDLDIGVATPTLLAADPDGTACDVPAIVMTEVPGRPELAPSNPQLWAEAMAACLAELHQCPPPDVVDDYRRWDNPSSPIPTWVTNSEAWLEARSRVAGPLPVHDAVFIHRDFHPCNIHWSGAGPDQEVCGVVDWLSACRGPAAVDLAHCRWNLAILFDADLADHFTQHYRTLTGYAEDLVAYDLSAILCSPIGPFPTSAWNALGRMDMTSEVVGTRIEAWIDELLGS